MGQVVQSCQLDLYHLLYFPIIFSLHKMLPVLYLGCMLWWDMVPESSQMNVFSKNLELETYLLQNHDQRKSSPF